MPGLAAPPGMPIAATIDVSPGPDDITSFEQAREVAIDKGPPQHPTAMPATNGSQREITLDASADPNRSNVIPKDILDGLDDLAKVRDDGSEVEKVAKADEPDVKVEKTAATIPPAADDADLDKQIESHKGIKELRTAHKEALKRERAWQAEQNSLKTKLTELETRSKTIDPEVTKTLTAQIEAAEKRRAELEEQVKLLDYTKSSEFHDRHVKPIAKAYENAFSDLNEMVVQQEDGSLRKATQADFQSIVQAPLHEAATKAKAMFGDLSNEVLAHRRQIVQLERSRREAMETAGKAGEESRQRAQVEQAQRTERFKSAFEAKRAEVENKHPDLFKPKDGDAERNDMLAKGHKLFEALESSDLNDDQRVSIAAQVRQRAAAFGAVLLELRRAEQRATAAEAKLKGYEVSAPSDGGRSASTGSPADRPKDPMRAAEMQLEAMATRMPGRG